MRSVTDGPAIQFGNSNPQQRSNSDAGPNIEFQGNCLIDSRFAYAAADTAPSNSGVPCWFGTASLEALNIVPATKSTNGIAATQATTAGTPLTLTAANSVAISVNIPVIPYGVAIQPTQVTTPVLAIDFGFATVTTTTGATGNVLTVTGPQSAAYANNLFYPGQKIVVAGAGNAAGTAPLFATVLATNFRAIAGSAITSVANTVLISAFAQFAGAVQQVGTADPNYGICALPVTRAGAAQVWDSKQIGGRVLSYTSGTTVAGTVTTTGYDVYGQLMHETVTPVVSSTVNGLKAFKYILSVVPSGINNNLSIGTADLFGIPIRTDLAESLNTYYAAAFLSTQTTFVAGVTATPTALTGDVRGTIGVPSATNGTNRLFVYANPSLYQCIEADNIDPRTLVGQVQF
jgi:hypothetical protein